MANSLTYLWTIFCETEGKNIIVEQKHRPLTCPNNPNHVINQSLTNYDINLLPPIMTDKTKNIGYFISEGVTFDCPANTTTTYSLSFPYDITLVGATLQCSDENKGDDLSILLAPDKIVGMTTQTVNPNDNEINLNNDSFEYWVKGSFLTLGSETICVKSVDLINSKVTTVTPFTNTYPPGTYAKRTVYIIRNIKLYPGLLNLGRLNPYPSYIVAGIDFKIKYTNNSNTDKSFSFFLDYY